MNRKQRRANRANRARFERELTKVVNGDSTADPSVAAFWRDYTTSTGVAIAVPRPDGVEVLRRHPETDEGGTR